MADIVLTIADGTPAHTLAMAKHAEYKAADLAAIDEILARTDLTPEQRTALEAERAKVVNRTPTKTVADLARLGLFTKEKMMRQPALEKQARELVRSGLDQINTDLRDF